MNGVVSMPNQPFSRGSCQRLNRLQQLTLTTWRYAARKLDRVLEPYALLEQTAMHACQAALRDVDQPVDLFARHATAVPEFNLIVSLVHDTPGQDLAYDLLDAGFLNRWNELVAVVGGPEELPPL